MPDHINISNPDRDVRYWEHRLEVAVLETRIRVLESERNHYRDQLEAIHTRIGRGDDCWLQINGEKVVISRIIETAEPATGDDHDPS